MSGPHGRRNNFDRHVTREAVSVRHVTGAAGYPSFPYNPPENYPEFRQYTVDLDPRNAVYGAVRNLLVDLDLDSECLGTERWSPFRHLIREGQTALIKPNWVRHFNPVEDDLDALVTHTSVIRVVIDYLLLAMNRKGTITIADAPFQDCDFHKLTQLTAINRLISLYRPRFPGVKFKVIDLRKTVLKRESSGIRRIPSGLEQQLEIKGDPEGYTLVDLGEHSFLTDISGKHQQFRVTLYDPHLLQRHHNRTKHEYLISNSVLGADFLVNVPKLKCHTKTGITGALKNLVGMVGHKEYLPHHTNGSPRKGGDQYIHASLVKPLITYLSDHYWANVARRSATVNALEASLIHALCRVSRIVDKDGLSDGSWCGNDTIPRTVLDLNHILYHYDFASAELSSTRQRRALHIVDGVVSGQGHGPLKPVKKNASVLVAGFDPLLVDSCIARLAGFDPMKLRTIAYAFTHPLSRMAQPPATADQVSLIHNGQRTPFAELPSLGFSIPEQWQIALLPGLKSRVVPKERPIVRREAAA
jgi:uncharacterized protein (DUF362 family)